MGLVRGTDGNDTLTGTEVADQIVALDGDDIVRDPGGSDTIDLGAGNDELYTSRLDDGTVEHVTILGGDGDDTVFYGNLRHGSTHIDLGAGSDWLLLYREQPGGVSVTMGEGRDVLSLYISYDRSAGDPVRVTDFAAGASGDFLDFLGYFAMVATTWHGVRNPFAAGYLRVRQDGDASVLEFDADGFRRGSGFATLVALDHVTATTLTAANLSGLAPDGSVTPGLRVTYGDGDDRLGGTTGGDRIHAGGGSDSISGGVGNDRLWGDVGNDILNGGAGNDRLLGGDGNDMLYDNGGSNIIDAGAGNDIVLHQTGFGGSAGGDATILAGDGLDYVRYQNFNSGSLFVDLGTGNDEFDLYSVQDGGAAIVTGTGSDTIGIRWDGADHFLAAAEVVDFTAGTGGDRLALADFLGGAAPTWDGTTNPFAAGFVRLTSVEGATWVEVDRDGVGGSYGFAPLVRLDGVASAELNAFNFAGFDPHADAGADTTFAAAAIFMAETADWPLAHLV